MATDRELLADGSEDSLRELIERYYTWIVGVVSRLMRNAMEAEDVTQEVILKSFTAVKQGQMQDLETETIRPYLFTICRNEVHNYYRKRAATPPSVEDIEALLPLFVQEESSLETDELNQKIQQAIASLSHINRQVILLKHFHGFSIKEIANILDITTAAVKSQLQRARTELADMLKGL